MAAYGAQRRAGKTDRQAIQYLYKFFRHVPVQPDSARAALQIFAQGKGDVLITYENEAIYAEKKGVHTQYKTPKATLLIETPVALTRAGLKKPAAKAFYKYLWSATAQKAFAAQGYRPVVKSVAKGYTFYKPAGLFTINTPKLGLNGWDGLNRRFFHPQKGIVAKIENDGLAADHRQILFWTEFPAGRGHRGRHFSRARRRRSQPAASTMELPQHHRAAAARGACS